MRRDPYAVYARRILGLSPLEPLIRDPGAAERGTLFHEVLHLFSRRRIQGRRMRSRASSKPAASVLPRQSFRRTSRLSGGRVSKSSPRTSSSGSTPAPMPSRGAMPRNAPTRRWSAAPA
ncbi:hypothetical protein [Mesorhizobium sp.]|uniref:hypothetical protein n=1 Tax=Mesorhizobium sp. TaxID=1871066 RepID=UPI00341ADC61